MHGNGCLTKKTAFQLRAITAQNTGINTLDFVANLCPMSCRGTHLNKPDQKPDSREPIEESTQFSFLEQKGGGEWIWGDREMQHMCPPCLQTVNSWKTSTFNQSNEARLFADTHNV